MDQKPHILIIDDDHDVLNTIKDALINIDFLIDCETNSNVALERIKSTYYDLVITDIMMPNVSGVEIVEAVKNTGRDTLVIIVTGFASIETAIKSVQFGVYDYVQKPLVNIQHIVENALDKLDLQRKNKLLNQKMKEMLQKVTLLNEISTILYQVSDFKEATEMILDTLTEGLKINRVGILLEDSTSSYVLVEHKNLVSTIVDKFKFHLNDRINNQQISHSIETVIDNLKGEISISDDRIPVDNSFKKCILIPIDFHVKLLGFIAVFPDANEIEDISDSIKLLKIFSNLIAPIVSSSTGKLQKVVDAERKVSSIIEEKIVEAKSSLAPISFALIRFVMLQAPHEESLLVDYLTLSKNTLVDKSNSHCEITWLTKDTVCVSYSGIDLFAIEKFCFEVSESIEKLQITGNKEAVMTTKYSCVSYPQVANSPARLENILWKHLFEELVKSNSVKKYNQL